MKQLFNFLRIILIAVGWTWLFVTVTDLLFVKVWNFDFMSKHSWNIVKGFWESGGNIRTYIDILLFAALFLLPILWIIGFNCALRLDYERLFSAPLRLFSAIFNIGSQPSEHLTIRPTKSTEQQIEEIKNEIASIKPQKNQNTASIRSAIKEKLSDDL